MALAPAGPAPVAPAAPVTPGGKTAGGFGDAPGALTDIFSALLAGLQPSATPDVAPGAAPAGEQTASAGSGEQAAGQADHAGQALPDLGLTVGLAGGGIVATAMAATGAVAMAGNVQVAAKDAPGGPVVATELMTSGSSAPEGNVLAEALPMTPRRGAPAAAGASAPVIADEPASSPAPAPVRPGVAAPEATTGAVEPSPEFEAPSPQARQAATTYAKPATPAAATADVAEEVPQGGDDAPGVDATAQPTDGKIPVEAATTAVEPVARPSAAAPAAPAVGETAPLAAEVTVAGSHAWRTEAVVSAASGGAGAMEHHAERAPVDPARIQAQALRGVLEQIDGAGEGRREVTLRLDPENLGRVEVKVTGQGDRLVVEFVAEGAEAEQALRAGARDLARAIGAQAGRWQHVDVRVAEQPTQAAADADADVEENEDERSGQPDQRERQDQQRRRRGDR